MEKLLDKNVVKMIHADYKKENQKKMTKRAIITFVFIALIASIIGFIAVKNSPAAQCEKYARMMYSEDNKEEPEYDYLLIEYTDTLKIFKAKTSVSYQNLYGMIHHVYNVTQAQYEMGKMPEEISMLRLMKLAKQFLPSDYNHPELLPVSEEDVRSYFENVAVTALYANGNKVED